MSKASALDFKPLRITPPVLQFYAFAYFFTFLFI